MSLIQKSAMERGDSPVLPPGPTTSPCTGLTFYGYLASRKDAYLLIECCMRGILTYYRPPQYASCIQHGYVFVYPTKVTGFATLGPYNEFSIESQFGVLDGLTRKTLHVFDHIVESYYNPMEVPSLPTPLDKSTFRVAFLRPELACLDPQSFLELNITVYHPSKMPT